MSSFLAISLWLAASTVFAQGPGLGTLIYWHEGGCSQPRTMALGNPDTNLGVPPCINETYGGFPNFPNGSPAGGWEIQNMPDTATFEVSQGPPGGQICGPELILQVSQSGCYDLPNLGNVAWWQFCTTGVDCEENQAGKRSEDAQVNSGRSLAEKETGVIHVDSSGREYMIANTGEIIPVYRQNTTTQIDVSTLHRRQSDTYDPPQSCILTADVCVAEEDEENIYAVCVDCVNGLGNGVQASKLQDCRSGTAACPVSFDTSVTVTDSISFTVGGTGGISATGSFTGSSSVNFGLGFTYSVAVTHGQTLGLSVPGGEIGYAQYQPPAVLGTVVQTFADATADNLCNGVSICNYGPGILGTTSDDTSGQYSIVITS